MFTVFGGNNSNGAQGNSDLGDDLNYENTGRTLFMQYKPQVTVVR